MADKHGITFVEQDQPRERASKLNQLIRWLTTNPIFDTIRVGAAKWANDGTITGATISADQVEVDELSTATNDDVQDWLDKTQSAGVLTGGAFTDNGDGTLAVAAGTGFVKTTDSATGATVAFDWAADASVTLTDAAQNHVYVDYNGGLPKILATTTPGATVTHTTMFNLGTVYRSGTDLHMVEGGTNVSNLARRTHRAIKKIHDITRTTGLLTTETGTRQILVSAGELQAGLNAVAISAFDSTSTNFTYWYNDGAWQSSATGTIDNEQYNDYGTGLASLTSNRYGVHWVFMDWDSHAHVVYGIGDYTLAQAEDADLPANLPPIVSAFSAPIAKIIIQDGSATFLAIETPFTTPFTTSETPEHNDLGGLQGGTTDEYYHLTATEQGHLSGQDQSVKTDSSVTFADVTASGTETDELVDIDRTIDADVTKGAVQVTEARGAGTWVNGGYGGYNYTGTINTTFVDKHAGFMGTMTHTAGTLVGGLGAFIGLMGMDGETAPAIPGYVGPFVGEVASNSGTARYGAYTLATNKGTGDACGYYGYGTNSNGSSGRAYGLYGYADSTSDLELGVFASANSAPTTKSFSFGGSGHMWNTSGSLYLRSATAVTEVTSGVFCGHIGTTDYGSAYIEAKLEVDGAAYFDGGAETTALKVTTGAGAGKMLVSDADGDLTYSDQVTSIPFLIDGGGSAISTGIAGWVKVDFACTITGCWLLADQSGAIKVDIWKDTYANYPPDNGDTITGGNEPEIAASGVKDEDTTLTSWTTSISAGDILYFNVDSCATIEKCLVSLRVTRA